MLDEQYLASAGDGVSKLLVFLVMRVIHHQLQLPKVFQHFERGDAHAAVFLDDLVAPGVVGKAGQRHKQADNVYSISLELMQSSFGR